MITRNKNSSFSKQIIDLFLVILFTHLNCWSNEVRSADTTTTSKISAFVLELEKVFWQNFSTIVFSYTLYFSSFYDKHFSWVMKYGKVRKKAGPFVKHKSWKWEKWYLYGITDIWLKNLTNLSEFHIHDSYSSFFSKKNVHGHEVT